MTSNELSRQALILPLWAELLPSVKLPWCSYFNQSQIGYHRPLRYFIELEFIGQKAKFKWHPQFCVRRYLPANSCNEMQDSLLILFEKHNTHSIPLVPQSISCYIFIIWLPQPFPKIQHCDGKAIINKVRVTRH